MVETAATPMLSVRGAARELWPMVGLAGLFVDLPLCRHLAEDAQHGKQEG